MLPQGIVAPTGSFNDTPPHIREKAGDQLKKKRLRDAAYTLLLVAQLPKDTTIENGYFDDVISSLKAKALRAINAGNALLAHKTIRPIAILPKHGIAIGCFNDLFDGVRQEALKQLKALEQLKAKRLRNACDTLTVLHAMPEMGSISGGSFDDVLLRLQTLLVKSIAAINDDAAKRIVSLVGLPLSKIGGCVDMSHTIYDQVRKAIDTGHLERVESVLVLVVRFGEARIPRGCFDDLLPWIEYRATEAFDNGRKMVATALDRAADLLYARCIEGASLPDSANPASTPELSMN